MKMTYEIWLEVGVKEGYCTEPICGTHEGWGMTDEEYEKMDEGDDPCVPIVRLL